MKKILPIILIMLVSLTGCGALDMPKYERYHVKCEITGYNATECRETTIFVNPENDVIFSKRGYYGEIGDFYSVEFVRRVDRNGLVVE